MGFTEAVESAWNKKFDYASRSGVSEYWWFALLEIVTLVGIALFAGISSGSSGNASPFGTLLYLVAVVFFFVLGLPLSVRRLHDTNKSGWFLLLGFIPFVGGLVLLVFYIMPGDVGPNSYGE